jgi:hypothetical protein
LKNYLKNFLNEKDTNDNSQLWSTGTSRDSGDNTYRIIMQTDNNLVIYNSFNSPIWNTVTYGKGYIDCFIKINNNGNLAMYKSGGSVVWQTYTNICI